MRVLYALILSAGLLSAETPSADGSPPMPSPPGESGPIDRPANLPRLFLSDTRRVLGSRWDQHDWLLAGAGAAAILGTALLLDRPLDRAMARSGSLHNWDRAAKAVEPLGTAPGALMAIGVYLAGTAFHAPEVRATGTDAMLAVAISELAFVVPLKLLAGRSRPSANRGIRDVHPFGGGASFPSGHTTVSFALASVIATHADRAWVSWTAYGLAGLVGVARMEQRSHFLSDVTAGALIGTFVGKVVVAHNQGLRRPGISVSLAPALFQGGYGMTLSARF